MTTALRNPAPLTRWLRKRAESTAKPVDSYKGGEGDSRHDMGPRGVLIRGKEAPSTDKPTGEENANELRALQGTKVAAGPAAMVSAKPPKPPTVPPVPQVAPKTPSQNVLLSKQAPRAAGMPAGVPDLTKKAITTTRGGIGSRLMANTLGRLNPRSLFNLILTSKAYHDPSKTEQRRRQHEITAKLLEKIHPDALKHTKLRLGGMDLIDDILWKKENPGEPLPWYKQLGGRVLHNPRSGPIGKILGYPGTALGTLYANLSRASHYNPATDVATIYAHDNPVTEHELGHAIDFNRLFGWGKVDPKLFKRIGKGTVRDLYGRATQIPPLFLWPEAQANLRSSRALEQALGESTPRWHRRQERRWEVLPAGYGSYLGGAVAPLFPPGPLVGLIGGKAYGLAHGHELERRHRKDEEEAQKQKKPAKPEEREERPLAKAAGLRRPLQIGSNELKFNHPVMPAEIRSQLMEGTVMTTKSAAPVMNPSVGTATDLGGLSIKPPMPTPAPTPRPPTGPSPMALPDVPPAGAGPSPMAPPDVPQVAAPGPRAGGGRATTGPFAAARDFASNLASGAQEFGRNLPSAVPPPTLPGPLGVAPAVAGEVGGAAAGAANELFGGGAPGGGAPGGPGGPGGANPYQGNALLDWAPKLLGMDYQSMSPIIKGILSIGGPVLLLLLLTKLFGKSGSYSRQQVEAAGDFFDAMSRSAQARLWAESNARASEMDKLACSMAKRYSKTYKVKKSAVPAPLASAPRFSRTQKPQKPKRPGQFPPGNRFQGAKIAADSIDDAIDMVMNKYGTWVTRNGKRVHIKHRKRRRKRSSQEQHPLQEKQSQGLLGALIGTGVGAGMAPERRRTEGAVRGAGIGLGTGIGAGLGGLAGGELAKGLGSRPYSLLTALLGLGGALGAGYGGYRLGKHFLWPKHWARMRAAQEARRMQAEESALDETALRDELVAKNAAATPEAPLTTPGAVTQWLLKRAKRDMPSFTEQDRPEKSKEIYRALKRDHPEMPAAVKARIAARQGKPGKQHQGPPYKAPLSAPKKSKD